jgi:hypothetical protein
MFVTTAIVLLGTAAAMIWYEVKRQPAFLGGQYLSIVWWVTYCSFLVLGASCVIAAVVR